MLQICPKLPNQQFEEPPFEEAILTFLRDLGHSASVKKKQARSDQAPKSPQGKRLKTLAKAAKPAKKKQPAKTLKKDQEKDKIGSKRDKNGEHDNGQEDDGQDNESQDDDNEQTDLDNDGDDFVHPKFSTHDQDERNHEEDSFDPTVQTSSHVESTDDEDSDEEIQGVNVEGDELDEEETNEEDEGSTAELFYVSGFISNMHNPSPNTGIDFIFNLNTESTSLVDVPVTTIVEPPLLVCNNSSSTTYSSHHTSMEDPHESFNKLMDTPLDFLAFVMNRLKVDTLTLELLAGVESYQKKLNLTKPDTYKSDLKRRDTYTAYFNPRGFIYQNKDKKNRLMRIDELQKFSDGTLNDVWTALNDHICHRLSGDKVIKIKQEL
nr:hypothetical protein [Tanacetum cinerariifolium]